MSSETDDLSSKLEAVVKTVAALRGPQGCPWDKEQTHESLVPYAIEETFELAQAIESKDDQHFKDELGDVLFQVLLHSEMAKERNAFTLSDVIENLNAKLIRRHPHVFSGEHMADMETIYRRWDEIKAQEKKDKQKPALEVSPMPALQRSHKIGAKTKKWGFDWEKASDVKTKVLEEIAEIDEAIADSSSVKNLKQSVNENSKVEEEIGDLLFSVAQWSRHLGIDPESALRKSNEKFLHRFNLMIEESRKQDLQFTELSPDQKESLWSKIKNTAK
ncbi:MAG: nucleoside triphosphate pyrophosphohydrolase [Bdellovibrionota bacterium]